MFSQIYTQPVVWLTNQSKRKGKNEQKIQTKHLRTNYQFECNKNPAQKIERIAKRSYLEKERKMLHGRKYAVECNNKKHVQVILIRRYWLSNCGKRYIRIACISKHILMPSVRMYFSLFLRSSASACLSLLFSFARYKQNLFAFAVAVFPIYNAIILYFYFIRVFVQFTHSHSNVYSFSSGSCLLLLFININRNGFHVSTNSNYLLSRFGAATSVTVYCCFLTFPHTQSSRMLNGPIL